MMHCNRVINSTSLRLLFFCSVGQPGKIIEFLLITISATQEACEKCSFKGLELITEEKKM